MELSNVRIAFRLKWSKFMISFPNENAIVGALYVFPDVYNPLSSGLSWNIRELYEAVPSVKLTLKLTYTINNIIRTAQATTTIIHMDPVVKPRADIHNSIAAYIVEKNLFRSLVLEIEHKLYLSATNAVQDSAEYHEYSRQFAKELGVNR